MDNLDINQQTVNWIEQQVKDLKKRCQKKTYFTKKDELTRDHLLKMLDWEMRQVIKMMN